MPYIQLKQPNLSVTSRAGLCLWFTQEVWGVRHIYSSATEAYSATSFRHLDRSLPTVPVILWFESWGSYGSPAAYDNWGHVASWIPGKGILSSPVSFVGPGQEWFDTIDDLVAALNKYGGRSSYLGWSEDLSGVRIVKEGGPMGPGNADNYTVEALAEGGLGRTANGDKNLMNSIGQPVNTVIDTFRFYPEWKERQRKADNYDADVKAAYEKGKADAGKVNTDAIELAPGLYEVKAGGASV